MLLTQADISNGEIGVAGTGSIDYSGEPRLKLGFCRDADVGLRAEADVAGPDRAGSARMGDRADRDVVRFSASRSASIRRCTICRGKGPPIPDDGLSVNIVANGVTVAPVDGLPAVHDADLKAHVPAVPRP